MSPQQVPSPMFAVKMDIVAETKLVEQHVRRWSPKEKVKEVDVKGASCRGDDLRLGGRLLLSALSFEGRYLHNSHVSPCQDEVFRLSRPYQANALWHAARRP